jgi:hypothetical protein
LARANRSRKIENVWRTSIPRDDCREVGALERKGYVARAAHPEDGRAVLLSATARGQGLCSTIQDELVAQAASLIGDLEPSVRQGAVILLRRLAAAAHLLELVLPETGVCSGSLPDLAGACRG